MPKKPALVGVSGHVEGEEMVLDYGKTVVVGRSRSADFSFRRIPDIASLSDMERENDHELRTVSGKHFEITPFGEDSIEIVNLSPNGTYVDGKRVDKIVLDDVAEKEHQIRIGAKETLRLELREVEGDEKAADEAEKEEGAEEEGSERDTESGSGEDEGDSDAAEDGDG